MNFWEECLAESLDEHGVTVTDEQLTSIAKDMQMAHENYGMVHYQSEPPYHGEMESLKKEIEKERSKIGCKTCNGSGRITTNGPYHSSNSECYKCRGEGKIIP